MPGDEELGMMGVSAQGTWSVQRQLWAWCVFQGDGNKKARNNLRADSFREEGDGVDLLKV